MTADDGTGKRGPRASGRSPGRLLWAGSAVLAVALVALLLAQRDDPPPGDPPRRPVAVAAAGGDVVVLDDDGRLVAMAGGPDVPTGLVVPGARALAAGGTGLVVVDGRRGEVRRLGKSAEEELLAGPAQGLAEPVAVAADLQRVVVVDAVGPSVWELREEGSRTRLAGAEQGLVAPTAVALAADGTVLVADPGARCVHVVSPTPRRCGTAGREGAAGDSGDGGRARQALLQEPVAVATAPDGAVYVADRAARRVRVIREGLIEPFAGDGREGSGGDGGPALRAQLRDPTALAVAGDGTVYVVDGGRVRAVDPDGIITAVP